ncbi:glycosyltransferase [Synechocystis sp. PCC 7509]|uniref:glycosyltransferase n=1 Tax=Synechocystis sp. PCC 7509 TaxID=927677 RepID=UPI0002ABE2FC|nr:glycosyltransferase [Synechocystis sp. PCC 7509]
MNSKLTQKAQLSIIIPCFNGADTIALQLEALARQQWSGAWEVIVCNNNSTDNTVAVVKQYADKLPNLRIVDAFAKQGVAYVRNVGIAAANSSDAFVICDADDQVSPGWLAAMGDALSKYDFVTGPLEFTQLNEPWRVQKHEDKQKEPPGSHQETPFFAWGNGCNIGFTRTLIETIGSFDESLIFGEDIEFSWRAQQGGFELHFIPEATIHYRLRHDLVANYIQSRNWAKAAVAVKNRYGLLKGKFVKLKLFLGGWKGLLVLLVKIRTKEDRVIWMRRFGGKIGEIQGCMEYLF